MDWRAEPTVLAHLFKALLDLGDRRVRAILWRSVGLSILVLIALGVGVHAGVAALVATQIGWIDTIAELGIGFAVFVLVWVLFPAAVSATLSLFLEPAAAAVEARHYPGLGPARAQPFREAIAEAARFAALAIVLNILALPLYVALTFLPPINFFVFYSLNGYLLGREYFGSVALRRLEARRAGEVWRANRGRVFVAGVIVALLLTIPLLNLAAPVIAVSFMLHLFQSVRREGQLGPGTPGLSPRA
jgi:uncharacterized protein involved in cysteine biosynthesis